MIYHVMCATDLLTLTIFMIFVHCNLVGCRCQHGYNSRNHAYVKS